MKRILCALMFLAVVAEMASGQFVLNGNFSSGTANWGCTPELNPETVYGGSNGANVVAEIDNLVSLCQTINGLIPGTVYNLRYVASRRLGGCPGPNPADIGVSIAGLNVIDSRSNTVWAMTTSAYQFTATATSHVLNIVQLFPAFTTCGFIIDDIEITVAVPFVTELADFEVEEQASGMVDIHWTTEQEHNLKSMLLERSGDAIEWAKIAEIQGEGEADSPSEYHTRDGNAVGNTVYYRLKWIDLNGQARELGTRALQRTGMDTPIFTSSPDGEYIIGIFPGIESAKFTWVEMNGTTHLANVTTLSPSHVRIDTQSLESGLHALAIRMPEKCFMHKFVHR